MKRTLLLKICLASILVAALLVAFLPVLAQTGGGFDISWNALFSGGLSSGGAFTMNSAIGQPFAGKVSASPYDLCAGYLCGVKAEMRVYLPLAKK